jgi:hypothetical protein
MSLNPVLLFKNVRYINNDVTNIFLFIKVIKMDLLKDICKRFKFDENDFKWNMLNHAGIVTA